MSLPAVLTPEAEEDVDTIRADLERIRVGLGDRFFGQLRDFMRRIEAMPEIYGRIWREVRAARLKSFRHVV